MKLALIFVTCLLGVLGHPYYRDRIPNGFGVPNPCGGGVWEAVGHYDPHHHTQDKNPFALAFAAAGHMWTADLCIEDSDGDGRSNGEELGDIGCTWTIGAVPARPASGHPGICEPIGSAACNKHSFFCGCHGHQCIG